MDQVPQHKKKKIISIISLILFAIIAYFVFNYIGKEYISRKYIDSSVKTIAVNKEICLLIPSGCHFKEDKGVQCVDEKNNVLLSRVNMISTEYILAKFKFKNKYQVYFKDDHTHAIKMKDDSYLILITMLGAKYSFTDLIADCENAVLWK